MDLGLQGRKAIVCASSKGLGRACAQALAEAGCTVVVNGRTAESLGQTTINNLLPGPFETERLTSATQAQAKMKGVPFEQAWEQRKNALPARRFGQPDEFGKLCAFVASAHAGYMTGQNFLIDGGSFPGAF